MRIKDVVKAPARLERRAIAARYGERHVGKLDGAADAGGRLAVANDKPPGASLPGAAERTQLAQSDNRAREALMAQQIGHELRPGNLGNAVESDCHAGAREGEGGGAGVDRAKVPQRGGEVARAGREIRLDGGA